MLKQTNILIAIALTAALTACESKEERVVSFVESGDGYLEKADFDAARIEYSNALQLDEHNVAALEGMLAVYEENKQLPEIYRTINKIIEIDPAHVEARRKLMNILVFANKLDDAMDHNTALLELDGNDIEANVVKAAIFYKQGKEAEGKQQAERVLEMDSSNKAARFMLATGLAQQELFEDALAMLEPATGTSEQDYSLNFLKINLLRELDRKPEANAVFEQLLAANPSDLDLLKTYANDLIREGKQERAEQLLREYINREEDNLDAVVALTQFVLARDGFDEAKATLQTEINKNPNEQQLLFVLADLYLSANDLPNAKSTLSQLANNSSTSQADTHKAKVSLAKIAKAEQNTEQEQKLYNEVLAQDPQNIEAVVGTSNYMIENDNAEAAIRTLREALGVAPQSGIVNQALGRAHEAERQDDLAQDHFSKARQYEPRNTDITNDLARFLLKRNQAEQAEDILQRAIDRNFANRRTLNLMAQTKLTLKKWDGAQRYADALEQAGENQSTTNQIRGIASAGKEEFNQSLGFFEEAQKASPDAFRPMASLVGAYIRSGNLDKAENFLDSTLQANPTSVNALMLKAAVQEYNKDFAGAEQTYMRTLEVDSSLIEAHRKLTRILTAQGKDAEALAATRNARKLHPEVLGLGINEALLLQKMGEHEQSIATYKDVVAKSPKADIAINNLALLLLEQGGEQGLVEAKELADQLRNTEIPHIQDTVGWIYLQSGNKVDALFLLEKAATELPDIAEIRYHLAMAYLANGREFEAKRELKLALEEGSPDYTGKDEAESTLAQLEQTES